MKPIEDTEALHFLKSVFDSEKKALDKEITRFSELTFKTDKEHIDNKSVLSELIVRRTSITEYACGELMEANTTVNFLIDSKTDRFICPRCLVHNTSEFVLTNDSLMTSGEGVLLCRKCGLSYKQNQTNLIPTPYVPLPEI